jgi:predicted nucleic acid-binding protein
LSVFVDTSVWSLLLRRERPEDVRQVGALIYALEIGECVVTTGFVLQELLQGFSGLRAFDQIVERFSALPLLMPDRDDHVGAAALRNLCRERGVQLGTIDALLSRLRARHELTLLTTDPQFGFVAKLCPLRIWHV